MAKRRKSLGNYLNNKKRDRSQNDNKSRSGKSRLIGEGKAQFRDNEGNVRIINFGEFRRNSRGQFADKPGQPEYRYDFLKSPDKETIERDQAIDFDKLGRTISESAQGENNSGRTQNTSGQEERSPRRVKPADEKVTRMDQAEIRRKLERLKVNNDWVQKFLVQKRKADQSEMEEVLTLAMESVTSGKDASAYMDEIIKSGDDTILYDLKQRYLKDLASSLGVDADTVKAKVGDLRKKETWVEALKNYRDLSSGKTRDVRPREIPGDPIYQDDPRYGGLINKKKYKLREEAEQLGITREIASEFGNLARKSTWVDAILYYRDQKDKEQIEQPEQPPREQPEQPPREQPEQPPREQPEQPPREQPEQPPREQPEQPPREQPEQPPREQPEQPPREQPEQPPREQPDQPGRAMDILRLQKEVDKLEFGEDSKVLEEIESLKATLQEDLENELIRGTTENVERIKEQINQIELQEEIAKTRIQPVQEIKEGRMSESRLSYLNTKELRKIRDGLGLTNADLKSLTGGNMSRKRDFVNALIAYQESLKQPEQPPREQPEQPPREQPEQPPREQPEQPPREQPEQPPREQPEQPPREQPEQPPREGLTPRQDAIKNVREEMEMNYTEGAAIPGLLRDRDIEPRPDVRAQSKLQRIMNLEGSLGTQIAYLEAQRQGKLTDSKSGDYAVAEELRGQLVDEAVNDYLNYIENNQFSDVPPNKSPQQMEDETTQYKTIIESMLEMDNSPEDLADPYKRVKALREFDSAFQKMVKDYQQSGKFNPFEMKDTISHPFSSLDGIQGFNELKTQMYFDSLRRLKPQQKAALKKKNPYMVFNRGDYKEYEKVGDKLVTDVFGGNNSTAVYERLKQRKEENLPDSDKEQLNKSRKERDRLEEEKSKVLNEIAKTPRSDVLERKLAQINKKLNREEDRIARRTTLRKPDVLEGVLDLVAQHISHPNTEKRFNISEEVYDGRENLESNLEQFNNITRFNERDLYLRNVYDDAPGSDPDNTRAFASQGAGVIQAGYQDKNERTAEDVLHEMTHFLEYANPQLKEAALAWIDSRKIPPDQENPSPMPGYDKSEVGWRGDYPDPYVAKYYGGRATEVYTTMWNILREKGEDAIFNDLDYLKFVLGGLVAN